MVKTLNDINLKTVKSEELVERSTVKINMEASKEERVKEYIKQIKNPYCYKDGNTIVKISFAQTDITMEECISHYLKGL